MSESILAHIAGYVFAFVATLSAVKVGLISLDKRVDRIEAKLDELPKDYVPRTEVQLGLEALRNVVEKTYSLVSSYLAGRGRTIHASAEPNFPVDPHSEERLAQVHPELARRVHAAMAEFAEQGTFFRVAQGLRSNAEQDALYDQGRTKPGHIVTNARGGYSNHNFGCAVDCFPFLSGRSGAINFDARSPQFAAMVEALQAQGLVWGGAWHTMPDPPHFQLPGVAVTPTDADRAAFAAGGLQAVWKALPTYEAAAV